MTPISPLQPADRSARQCALLEPVGGEESPNLFSTVVQNPDLFEAWLPFCLKLLQSSAFDRITRETAILRTAWRCRADYEWGHHTRIGRRAGLTDEQITSLTTPEPDVGDEVLNLIITAVDELLDTHTLSAESRQALVRTLTPEQLIELPMLVGHYSLLAMVLRSWEIPFDHTNEEAEQS